MSRKGKLNKKGRIEYPRICDQCGYLSNNPSMHHYHKQTHYAIPEGQLCDGGCGNLAQYIKTNGRMVCKKNSSQCPEYVKHLSFRVEAQWATEEADQRRINTRKSLIDRLHTPEIRLIQTNTKRKKFGTLDPERAKDYRHYARYVRERAQKWARDNGYEIGRQTYHVDHILSVNEAWKAGLPEPIVNHPVNLRILDSRLNSSKGAKSLISVEDLLIKIAQYEQDNK